MADGMKPYGAVEYADPEDGKYPIDTAEHAKAAWSYVNMPKNAAILGDKLGAIKTRIKAACKKFGIEISDDASVSRALDDDGTIERRAVLMPVELRAIGDGQEPSRAIGGYAAVFDQQSRMIPRMLGGNFIERVAPTFFNEARTAGWQGNQGSGVLCRYNHNDQYLLGTTRAGTLQLSVDHKGLEYRTEVPQCRDDVLELVGRGDIAQSSFTFMDAKDDWSYNDDGVTQRTLLGGEVLDVAPVSAVAAYPDATVGLRSLAAFKDVPAADVFALAQQHELRKLFIRTDIAPPTPPAITSEVPPVDEPPQQLELEVVPRRMSGALAKMLILGKRAADPIKSA